MDSPLQPDLEGALKRCRAVHPELPEEPLCAYLEQILRWNERIPLVSRSKPLPVLERLVCQSADLWKFVSPLSTARVADIGSGAGFPGIIFHLLSPSLSVALIERRAKKATFLERIISILGLDGVQVIEGNAEEIATDERHRGSYDGVTATAVATPHELAPTVVGLLAPGGWFATVLPRRDDRAGEARLKILLRRSSRATDYGTLALYATSG